jgi:hypothetical protein
MDTAGLAMVIGAQLESVLSEVGRVLVSGGALPITTGKAADVRVIVSDLNDIGFNTIIGTAENGIPLIEGVLP